MGFGKKDRRFSLEGCLTREQHSSLPPEGSLSGGAAKGKVNF